MTPLEMLTYTTRSAADCARREGTSVTRIKAETAERVMERIALGEISLSDTELLAANARANHASGTPDRSVAVSMLEVIIGIGIRHANDNRRSFS